MTDKTNLEYITSVIRGDIEYGSIATLLKDLQNELEKPEAEIITNIMKENPSLEDLLKGYLNTFVLGPVKVNGRKLLDGLDTTYFAALTADGEYLDLDKYSELVDKKINQMKEAADNQYDEVLEDLHEYGSVDYADEEQQSNVLDIAREEYKERLQYIENLRSEETR